MKRVIIQKRKIKGTRGYRYLMECSFCKNKFEILGSNYNKGKGKYCSKKCCSKDPLWKKNLSNSLKKGFKEGRKHPKGMKGKTAWNKGIENLFWKGVGNPNWSGGLSTVPYPLYFSRVLKRKVRKRDNYTCQNCGKKECDELVGNQKQRLSVHHIDYDKKNCNLNNLITLCRSCNVKANKNRLFWTKYYNKKTTR